MKRKILSFVFLFVIIVSTVAATSVFAAGKQTSLDTYTSSNLSKTVHTYSKTETSDYIVKNNASEYTVVIPANFGRYEKIGAEDFVDLFAQSTGAKLTIKKDNELGVWTRNSKIISLGHTSQLDKAGVSYKNRGLGKTGFVIKTVGKSIFITGEETWGFGAMYGAYELLTQLVDFREYGHNATHIASVDDLKFYDFDVIDIPDFPVHKDPCDDLSGGVNQYRMRFMGWGDFVMSVPGYGSGHSSFGYVDPQKYAYEFIKDENGNNVENENYHPEWFWYKEGVPVQLSLSAHGNEASRAQMLQVALDVLISIVNDNPDLDAVSFCQQDDPYTDSNDVARAVNKYGARSGEWVAFCNDLMDGLDRYFQDNNIDRKVKIFFFSYVFTAEPPIRNGQPTIKAKEGVVTMYCPIFADEAESIVAIDNSGEKGELDGWCKVCDEVWIWFYNACFYNYMYPRFSFNGIAENVKYAHQIGATTYFVESQTYSYKLWSFGELQNYLLSRLMWDTSLDQEELTQDWFKNYYGEVSGYMKKVYDLMEANYNYHNVKDALHNGTDGYDYQTAKIWPLAFLNQLIDLCDKALAEIEIYKQTDPDLYNNLYEKINFEKIPFQYAIVQFYSSYFSDAYILNLKKSVKKVATKIGALHWKEGTPISDLWEMWGV